MRSISACGKCCRARKREAAMPVFPWPIVKPSSQSSKIPSPACQAISKDPSNSTMKMEFLCRLRNGSSKMKNLFEATAGAEIKARIAQVRPDSQRLWGKMNAAQAIAHCAAGLKLALGDITPPRVFLGRIIGPIIKVMVFKDEEPLRRNSPTIEGLV